MWLSARIVAAYLAYNAVRAEDLPELAEGVYLAFADDRHAAVYSLLPRSMMRSASKSHPRDLR